MLRPGTLSDDEGTGKIDLGRAKMGGKVTREDVAETAVSLLELKTSDMSSSIKNGVWWVDLNQGDETVDEAVKRVAKEGISTE